MRRACVFLLGFAAAVLLTLGARVIGPELAKTIISAWVHSRFEGGRSLVEVERMKELERQEFAPAPAQSGSARHAQGSA